MARRSSRLPGPLRTFVGSAVLVVAVRTVDVVWRRVTGRPTPIEAAPAAGADASAPAVVRDRLVYALLLGGAARLARRVGLPQADAGARNGRSPA